MSQSYSVGDVLVLFLVAMILAACVKMQGRKAIVILFLAARPALAADPDLPPVFIEDLWLFGINPDLSIAQDEWQWMTNFVGPPADWGADTRLHKRLELARLLHPGRLPPTQHIVNEAVFARQAWCHVQEAIRWKMNAATYESAWGSPGQLSRKNCLTALQQLRELIGWEAYYAGQMPSTRWFRDLDRFLKEPIP